MEAILTSIGLVAIAEIGDKTQLLAIMLAAKFRKPLPIILGILAATLVNHAGAAALGYLVADWLTGPLFQLFVGGAFIAMGTWALIPDEQAGHVGDASARSVFLATAIAFFLVEIGDKTQIATSLLAAQFHDLTLITLGTTIGMMIANVPAVLAGEAVTRVVPLKYVRFGAAVIFVVVGIWIIAGMLLGRTGLGVA